MWHCVITSQDAFLQSRKMFIYVCVSCRSLCLREGEGGWGERSFTVDILYTPWFISFTLRSHHLPGTVVMVVVCAVYPLNVTVLKCNLIPYYTGYGQGSKVVIISPMYFSETWFSWRNRDYWFLHTKTVGYISWVNLFRDRDSMKEVRASSVFTVNGSLKLLLFYA